MKRLMTAVVLAAFLIVLIIPTAAFASEAEYARIGGTNPSLSTSSKWDKAQSGSVAGIASMFASIQNRSSSTYSWVTRKTTYVPAGTGVSSSVVDWSTIMYWRLGLTGIDGYGIVNCWN